MIVALGPVFPPAEEILGEIRVFAEAQSLGPLLPEIEGLIVRGASLVDADLIAAAPRLRVIGRTGVGVEKVDLDAATRRGIPVVITPDAGAQAVAEGALALMLALTKRLPELDRIVREGRWHDRHEVELGDLDGATLGIIGFGRIGRRLAALARPLGMEILACDPYADDATSDLPTLVERSDFISLHAPLTVETRGLVDAALLARVKAGAILVNLGRGALVSSPDDLMRALDSGRLAGVGLDVFHEEPPDVSHPLFRHPRVVLTPHALGLTRRSRERIFREMSEAMAAVLRGERAPAVANPAVYE